MHPRACGSETPPASQSLPALTTSRYRPRRLHPALLRRFRRLLSRSSQKPPVLDWLEGQFLQHALVCRSVEVFGSHVGLVLGALHLLQTHDLVTNGALIHSQRTWSCLVFPTPVREHMPIAAVESVSTATLMVRPISSYMCFVKILRAEPSTILWSSASPELEARTWSDATQESTRCPLWNSRPARVEYRSSVQDQLESTGIRTMSPYSR